MKLYLSGAITGTDDYMYRFSMAEKSLEAEHTIINPAKVNAQLPSDTDYEDYMKMAFCMLDMCDGIYLLKGWEKSCGSNRELGYAMAKGKIILRQ